MRENSAKITVMSRSENESFVRAAVSAFVSQLDPTLEELADIKTAVSEAVTNSIVHGYAEKKGDIMIDIYIKDDKVKITVTDNGCGIADVKEAMQPLLQPTPTANAREWDLLLWKPLWIISALIPLLTSAQR